MVGSKLPFLSKGRTCAVSMEAGNIACEKDKLVSLEIIEAKRREKRYKVDVEIKSNGEDLLGKERISLLTSSILTNEKKESCVRLSGRIGSVQRKMDVGKDL